MTKFSRIATEQYGMLAGRPQKYDWLTSVAGGVTEAMGSVEDAFISYAQPIRNTTGLSLSYDKDLEFAFLVGCVVQAMRLGTRSD